jgi:glycerol-3-phosphate dehydrogenase
MVTVAGGKWTTYRRIAHDAVEHLARRGLPVGPPPRAPIPLVGATRTAGDIAGRLAAGGFPPDVARHLAEAYGDRAEEVLASADDATRRLLPEHPYLESEVVWTALQEHASSVMDVLARRLRLAFLDLAAARRAVPRTAQLLGQVLGWDPDRYAGEVAAARKELHGSL